MINVMDWGVERCSTVGTGDLVLTGTNIGFARLKDGLPAGEVWYSIEDGSNRETGKGVFNGLNKIERTEVHASIYLNVYNNTTPTPIPLSGFATVACTWSASAYEEDVVAKEDNLGLPNSDGAVLASNLSGTRKWTDLSVLTGTQGPQGPQGPQGVQGLGAQGPQGIAGAQGPAGLGINIIGTDTVAAVLVKTASAIGDSYIASDTGVDSDGLPVAVDDVLRATTTSSPHWINIGAIAGPQGIQGFQGPVGPQGSTGLQGLQGPVGIQGVVGLTGPRGVTGQEGSQGIQGPSGLGTNVQGTASINDILLYNAGAVGDAYISSDVGVDSDGLAVQPDDVLRATNTETPSHWINIGAIVGPTGAQGAAGADGAQGPAGLGLDLQDYKTVQSIITLTALAVGEAYFSTTYGTDTDGNSVVPDDILRATDTASPSRWLNIGKLVVSDHNNLANTDIADLHPILSITGLQSELDSKLASTSKAADSELLDGLDSTSFALSTHNHDATYLGITDTAVNSTNLNGHPESYYSTSTHDHNTLYLGVNNTATDSNKLGGFVASNYALKTDIPVDAYIVQTSAYTAQAGERILADTSAGSFAITLPAVAQAGDIVTVRATGGDVSTNNLTVTRNSHNIDGLAEDYIIDLESFEVIFVYKDITRGWEI